MTLVKLDWHAWHARGRLCLLLRRAGPTALATAALMMLPVAAATAHTPSGEESNRGPSKPHSREAACAALATNPKLGLAGNPLITAVTAAVVPAAGTDAAYCNVQLTYSARSGTRHGYDVGQAQAINIGIGLPLNGADGGAGGAYGAWNGKQQNIGGGGCVGNVGRTVSATNAGYVGTTTDTGHTQAENGQRCDFGVIQAQQRLNEGKIDDFIYEAVYQQSQWGKTVARTYYGMRPNRNYWNGCSTGGRQGLALAQTHGEEFDGFLIGAPAIYWQQFRLADAWPALVVKDDLTAKGKALTTNQFTAANTAAVAACDGADGVFDGLIDDPRACTFSATANICGKPTAPAAPDCLDVQQAAAIDRIWDGPRNDRGLRIWYPFDRGIALGASGGFANFGAVPNSTAQVLSYNHRDLTFDVGKLFVDQAAAAGAADGVAYDDEATLGSRNTADLMDTQDVDLRAVKHGGGKILMWHGTADPAIRWRHSADYYRRVATYFGRGKADFKGLQSWFRYFHAPGVAHCGGGAGPAPVDAFGALVSWVERGVEPDSLAAAGGTLNPQRTRPLCPWPQTAIYKGSGSTDEAGNFYCGGNLDKNPQAVCEMVHTKYQWENTPLRNYQEMGIDRRLCEDRK